MLNRPELFSQIIGLNLPRQVLAQGIHDGVGDCIFQHTEGIDFIPRHQVRRRLNTPAHQVALQVMGQRLQVKQRLVRPLLHNLLHR